MTLHDPIRFLISRTPRQTVPLPHGRGSLQPQTGFTIIELLIVIAVILLLTAITVTVVTGITARSEIRETENTMRIMDSAVSEWELTSGRQITFGINGEPCTQNERYDLRPITLEGTDIDGGFTWPTGTTGDLQAARDTLMTADRMWAILSRSTSAGELLARIDPKFMVEIDPNTTSNPAHFNLPANAEHLNENTLGYRFLDAWDNPILAIMPGRQYRVAVAGICTPGDAAYCTGNMTSVAGFGCPDADGSIRTPFENRFGIAANRRIFFVSAGPSGRFGNLQLHLTRTNPDFSAEQAALAADNVYSYPIITEEGRPE